MGPKVTLIDSANHTAKRVTEVLAEMGQAQSKPLDTSGAEWARVRCFVSDNAERFAALGARFLHEPLGQVSYVPLDALIADPGGALGVMAGDKQDLKYEA